jgi:3-oxoacyl-[acyl-carrier protein] reductase
MSLTGKVALITGASRGIGQAIMLGLGKAGATVIGTATTATNADKISQVLAAENIPGQGLVLDVTQPAAVNDVLTTIINDRGSPSILVNNAGIARDNLMLRMKDEEWDEIINTDLSSVFRLTKGCLKGMLKARWGRIINISSVVGCSGNPGQANYAAAKAGIIGFSKSLAQEIASRDITVNVSAPGFIETDMTREIKEGARESLLKAIPMNRIGRPEEVAAAAVFLASPEASYITGITLHVNGGMYMS